MSNSSFRLNDEKPFMFKQPEHQQISDIHSKKSRARPKVSALVAEISTISTDKELLEILIRTTSTRDNIGEVADLLLQHYASFSNVLCAPVSELTKFAELTPSIVLLFKVTQAAAERLLRAEIIGRPVVSNKQQLLAYLRAAISRERVEQTRVLFLDDKNRIIAEEIHGKGTVGHSPVYPREIVRRALDFYASGIIIAHNHPSGDPSPSMEDVAVTRHIAAAAKALGIQLHDHIIIGNGSSTSLREEGLIPAPIDHNEYTLS